MEQRFSVGIVSMSGRHWYFERRLRRLRRSERRRARVAGIRLSIISALIILPFSFTANSILLSTITDREIQGAEPRLHSDLEAEIAAQAFSLFGFGFNGTDYYADNLSTLHINPLLYSPKSLKLAITESKIKALSEIDASDANGDGNFTLSSSSLSLEVDILNSSGISISDNDSLFSDSLCSSSAPYKVKIKISGDLSLATEYGNPRNKDYTDSTLETNKKQPSKEYEVLIAGICNLKPADMSVIRGYNAAKFDPANGFKVDSGFPTTGFAGASFSLLGSGSSQNLYRCNTTSADITLSTASGVGTNCTVTYKTDADHQARPTNDITIVMQARSSESSSDWSDIDSFTIKTSQIKKWAIGKGAKAYANNDTLTSATSFPALSACSGETVNSTSHPVYVARQQYLYRRNELTNSPRANPKDYPEWSGLSLGQLPVTEKFFRDTDTNTNTDVENSTFTGEWGHVDSYLGSGWRGYGHYWTSEANSSTNQFTVYTSGGVHGMSPTYGLLFTMCRG